MAYELYGRRARTVHRGDQARRGARVARHVEVGASLHEERDGVRRTILRGDRQKM